MYTIEGNSDGYTVTFSPPTPEYVKRNFLPIGIESFDIEVPNTSLRHPSGIVDEIDGNVQFFPLGLIDDDSGDA